MEKSLPRCVVVGGTGFVGRHTVSALKSHDWEVAVVDRDFPPSFTKENPSVKQFHIDLSESDTEKLTERLCQCFKGASVVILLAAAFDLRPIPIFGSSEAIQSSISYKVCVNSTKAVAEACVRSGCLNLVVCSSIDVVFRGRSHPHSPTPYDDPPLNFDVVETSMYAHCKKLGEITAWKVRDLARARGIDFACCILRLSHVYGPGEPALEYYTPIAPQTKDAGWREEGVGE